MANIDKVELDYLSIDDYDELKTLMIDAYSNMSDAYWRERHIKKMIDLFPDGQAVIRVDGALAGCALSIIVNYGEFDDDHSYKEITGNYTFDTHNSKGDYLYGIDIFIKSEFRGLRLGRRLYDYRKELCEKLNLKGILFGGRLPNYHKFAEELGPKDYIQKVREKEIHDPVLNFQLSNDFHVRKIIKGYLKGDKASMEYAALLEWINIYYEKPKKKLHTDKIVIRLGLVQWQMRPYKRLEDLMEQAEYFVDAVSGYRCDFVLFPEFFNAPLMAEYNHLSEPDAIRKLAEYTAVIRDEFAKLAISYNINIITGSMPEVVEGTLYNVGYLCHRDGTVDRFIKVHVTPDEARVWDMKGGDFIQSYNTDCGKIGILICYDVEFPELGRILADEGMSILFVPFLTDGRH